MNQKIRSTVDTTLDYYKKHRRVFPWRETKDPYLILVSEVMLQQTQTERVIPKFLEFTKKFPTVKKLAKASKHSVLSMWSGLGYNRRGVALHSAAKKIVAEYGGTIPRDVSELIKLPSIGEYTANALRAFAFNTDALIIETNIRTVILHHICKGVGVDDRKIRAVLEKMYAYAREKRTSSRVFYSAMMDYGAYLKSAGVKTNHLSKHYAKQSAFAGSVRQTRGELMRLFLKHEHMTVRKLENLKLRHSKKALAGLVADGMLDKHKNHYTLSD